MLLGGNANGQSKINQITVYHFQTPSVLKGIRKSILPVIWVANKKAQVMVDIFQNWFVSYFCLSLSATVRKLVQV